MAPAELAGENDEPSWNETGGEETTSEAPATTAGFVTVSVADPEPIPTSDASKVIEPSASYWMDSAGTCLEVPFTVTTVTVALPRTKYDPKTVTLPCFGMALVTV